MQRRMWLGAALALVSGCNLNVPFDPAEVIQPIDGALEGLQNAFEGAVTDPFGARPFPVLVGGDDEHVYYTTNLTDSRLNFPGPTGDVVIPGFAGPSNLYQFASRKRELIRPLVPAGSFFGMATDGRYIAYVSVSDVVSAEQQVVAGEVSTLGGSVVFSSGSDASAVVVPQTLALDGGRLGFILQDFEGEAERLRVQDLTGLDPTLEIEADLFGDFDLRGDNLAYVAQASTGSIDLVLRDLAVEESVVVAPSLRVEFPFEPKLALTENLLVWSEPTIDGLSRVSAYDVPSGETRVWADSVIGVLRGASDEFFVTEEVIDRFPDGASTYKIRRYDANGTSRVLAEFRVTGLSGQTTVIGNRAAWVNPDREVVLAPLAGGDRTIFEPF